MPLLAYSTSHDDTRMLIAHALLDPTQVQADATLLGHYTTLTDSAGVSDVFGVFTVPSGPNAGQTVLGFISNSNTHLTPGGLAGLGLTVQDASFVEQPGIINPVPDAFVDGDGNYLTTPYVATQYLSSAMRLAGYTATMQSDVPEPATLALMAGGILGLVFSRRKSD